MAKRAKREKSRLSAAKIEELAEQALTAFRGEIAEMIPPLKEGLMISTESHVWRTTCVGLRLRIMLSDSADALDWVYELAAYALLQEAKRQIEAEHGVQEVVE